MAQWGRKPIPPPDWCIPGMGIEGTVYTIVSMPFRAPAGVNDHERWFVTIRCQCGNERNVRVKVLRVGSELPRMCRSCYLALPKEERYRNPYVLKGRTRDRARRVKRFFTKHASLRKGEKWPDPILIDRRDG